MRRIKDKGWTRREEGEFQGLAEPFREGVRPFMVGIDAWCGSHDWHLLIVEGRRRRAKQEIRWARGRTYEAGKWSITDPPRVVTYAPPGSSKHERGLALDFMLRLDDEWVVTNGVRHQMLLPSDHQAWKDVAQYVRDAGFRTGADFTVWREGQQFPFRDFMHIEAL